VENGERLPFMAAVILTRNESIQNRGSPALRVEAEGRLKRITH